jgi:hypothetical protein
MMMTKSVYCSVTCSARPAQYDISFRQLSVLGNEAKVSPQEDGDLRDASQPLDRQSHLHTRCVNYSTYSDVEK